MILYKVLHTDGTPCHGGTRQWNLPTQNEDGTWAPGDWMPQIEGELEPCANGYHLCSAFQLIHWLGEAIFEAEWRGGDSIECSDKLVVREARLLRPLETWNPRTARLFACDCAEKVLPIYEKQYPEDLSPRRAIEMARRFANGDATGEELSAASSAAWPTGDTSRRTLDSGPRDTASAASTAAISAASGGLARDRPMTGATNAAIAAVSWAVWAYKRKMGELLNAYLNDHGPESP